MPLHQAQWNYRWIMEDGPLARPAGRGRPAFMRLAGHFMRDDGRNFDRTPPRRRNPRGQCQSLFEVLGFDQVVAAKLFLGLREWAIGDRALAVAHPHGLGFGNTVQFIASSHVATARDALGKLHVLLKNFILFRLAHLVEVVFVSVNKQQILHFGQASLPVLLVSRTRSFTIDNAPNNIFWGGGRVANFQPKSWAALPALFLDTLDNVLQTAAPTPYLPSES